MASPYQDKLIEYHGTTTTLRTKDGKLVTDRYGLRTCTAEFSIPRAYWQALPDLGAVHPIFGYISMSHRELSLDAAWATALCEYEGVPAPTPPIYELVVGVGEEPIETHPRFVSDIGGRPSGPLNGAIFFNPKTGDYVNEGSPASSDAGYVFFAFAATLSDGTKNPFAKIEQYLDPSQMTWRATTYVPAGQTAIGRVGHIAPPQGPAPQLPSPMNWLDMGLSSTQRGSAFQLVQEWRASGPRGWNGIVYG